MSLNISWPPNFPGCRDYCPASTSQTLTQVNLQPRSPVSCPDELEWPSCHHRAQPRCWYQPAMGTQYVSKLVVTFTQANCSRVARGASALIHPCCSFLAVDSTTREKLHCARRRLSRNIRGTVVLRRCHVPNLQSRILAADDWVNLPERTE